MHVHIKLFITLFSIAYLRIIRRIKISSCKGRVFISVAIPNIRHPAISRMNKVQRGFEMPSMLAFISLLIA